MDESVFQAVKIVEAAGGQAKGGKESVWPFGSPESAIEIPAIWYLDSQLRIRGIEVT